jgi:signal peptidase II
MVFIGLIILLAAVDLCVKKVIEEQDDASFPKELEGTGGKITLHKSHNPGFSFGVLKDQPMYVLMVPLAVASFLGGMLVCLLQKKGHITEKLALSITLGGAISNLYDRIKRRYVVDYFSIQYGKLKKVIFNLGDMFIIVGAGIFMISEIIRAIKER